MQLADQRSIRFRTYKGQTVLETTGNYYAAYFHPSHGVNLRSLRCCDSSLVQTALG
jgi:hypothetical protein